MDPILYTVLKNKGVPVKLSGDSHLILDCLECGREGKLYYNYKKHIGDCKVCNEYFTLTDISRRYQVSSTSQKAPKLSEIAERLHKVPETKKVAEVLPLISLPKEALPVKFYPRAMKFLFSRNIVGSQTNDYFYCDNGFYANRIIIPVYNEDHYLVGFQARTIFKHVGEKYLFNKGFQKNRVLYKSENLKNDPILVVENVFNAVWLNGVATFGRQLSEHQVSILCKSRHRVCFLWDYDSFTTNQIEKPISLVKARVKVRAIMFTEEKPQPDNWKKVELLKAVDQAFKKDQTIFRMEQLK